MKGIVIILLIGGAFVWLCWFVMYTICKLIFREREDYSDTYIDRTTHSDNSYDDFTFDEIYPPKKDGEGIGD